MYRSVRAFVVDAHHNKLLAVPAVLYAINNLLKFTMQVRSRGAGGTAGSAKKSRGGVDRHGRRETLVPLHSGLGEGLAGMRLRAGGLSVGKTVQSRHVENSRWQGDRGDTGGRAFGRPRPSRDGWYCGREKPPGCHGPGESNGGQGSTNIGRIPGRNRESAQAWLIAARLGAGLPIG
jgi:hypothetical protein